MKTETETETKATCKRQMMGYVWRHYIIKSNNNLYFVKFLVALDGWLSLPRKNMQISSIFGFFFFLIVCRLCRVIVFGFDVSSMFYYVTTLN